MMDRGYSRWDEIGISGSVGHNPPKVPREVFSACMGCLTRLKVGAN